MTGKTHKAGGALCAVVSMQILLNSNIDIEGVGTIAQFLVVYPYALWGSTALDFDHAWENVADKNPVNYAINKMLHTFNMVLDKYENIPQAIRPKMSRRKYNALKILSVKHRSWQTHSDLTLFTLLGLLYLVTRNIGIFSKLGIFDTKIVALCLIGTIIGAISHLLLDIITVEGIKLVLPTLLKYLYFKLRRKRVDKVDFVVLRIVPKNKTFTVNGEYEKFVCNVIKLTTYMYIVALLFLHFVYPNKGVFDIMFNSIKNIF